MTRYIIMHFIGGSEVKERHHDQSHGLNITSPMRRTHRTAVLTEVDKQ